MKNFRTKWSFYIVVLAYLLSLPIYSQQSMSLGDLKFVMPSENLSKSARSLTIKMAKTGITPKIYAKVGGVAFIQTASPQFTINSISLDCDYKQNKAIAVINDTTYTIPLEAWELMSIAEFADSENNAAVTLYGDRDKEARIKYHPAFLDNLMGLRILQTDMMLILPIKDRGKFPSYTDDSFILSDGERNRLNSWMIMDSLVFGKSHEEMSIISSYGFILKSDSIDEKHDTYIYTDYNEPISFYPEEGELKFNGKPYYRFASRDSVLVDTLEMYSEIVNFVDTLNLHKKLLRGTYIEDLYSKKASPKLTALEKLTRKNKNVSKKSVEAFNLTGYYSYCDSIINDDAVRVIRGLYKVLMKNNMDKFTDSIVNQNICANPQLYNICQEYSSLKNKLTIKNHYPIIAEYARLITEIVPEDSISMDLDYCLSTYDFTYDALLIEYMYTHRTPSVIETTNLTSYFKEHETFITLQNPIVFEASNKVCHWAAFFRYIKENHYEEWQQFKDKVCKLKYDAPIVQTPIDFKREF